MTAKIAIIQFPGSNCEREAILTVKRVGMEPVPFLWNESPEKLRACDGYFIVGGFSYEDRSRAGIIAAQDPVLSVLRDETLQGKPLIGICNGAQILVETGLVPGAEHHALAMALTLNKRVQNNQVLGVGYYNEWVNVTLGENCHPNAFNRHLKPGQTLKMPVAHAEGRYVMPEATLNLLKKDGLIAFQYCDAQGDVHNEFPVNPNGSMASIAGVTNKQGNILSLMPHPERSEFCDAIFASIRDYIAEKNYQSFEPLLIEVQKPVIKTFKKSNTSATFIVDLIITDNQAVSVQNALNQTGIPVTIRRQEHWEIFADDIDTVKKQIIDSGELFNRNKEKLVSHVMQPNTKMLLVRQHDDIIGQSKQQYLTHHFGIQGIQAIRHGILWHVSGEDVELLMPKILETHIFYNPFAQEGFDFL